MLGKIRKGLCLLLVCAMLFTLVPVSTFAVPEVTLYPEENDVYCAQEEGAGPGHSCCDETLETETYSENIVFEQSSSTRVRTIEDDELTLIPTTGKCGGD